MSRVEMSRVEMSHVGMSHVHAVVAAASVAVRRRLVRHPWIYWALAATLALAVAAVVLRHVDRIDASRAAWGETRTVWVATAPAEPGEAIVAERRELPVAMLPEAPAANGHGVARRRVGRGEVLTDLDVAARAGPLALVPGGWVAVPVVERPASGAEIGEHVVVAGEGVVLAEGAVVVGRTDDATLVATPADAAPAVAAATATAAVTLLRTP